MIPPTPTCDIGIVQDGGAFSTNAAGQGILGRFDQHGAWLRQAQGGISVRTVGWGRALAMVPVGETTPRLGACVAGGCVRRLTYAAGDLSAWWAGGPEGIEQGWTVSKAPFGSGPLLIDVEVTGAVVRAASGELLLDGAAGASWVVRGLVARDSDGVQLDTRMVPEAGGFRVSVADLGARYPIEIDPVYTTAVLTLSGAETGAHFGASVADAGDVNGDGFADLILGSFGNDRDTGRAYVYTGAASGPGTTADTTLTGETTYNYLGWSVSGAGDVDGDGYDDVLVGASGYRGDTGKAYLYAGSPAGVASTASATLTGEATSDHLGAAVADAGDVDGDGYADVVVGAYGASSETGAAYVFVGSASGLTTTASTTLTGATLRGDFGITVAGAGDVDGDGYSDVIIGAPGGGTGAAYLYSGSADGVASSATTLWSGEGGAGSFGTSVAGAGDVNADGYDDVVIGDPDYDGLTGRVYVYSGSPAGPSTTADATRTGTSGALEQLGDAVSGAGDVNGDGYADIVAGAYGYHTYTGAAYLFIGSASGISDTPRATLTGEARDDYFGIAVSGAGDIDGDGYGEIVVGASFNTSATGRAYVYAGADRDLDGDGILGSADCDDDDATVYPGATETVADRIDQDCDGVDSCYADLDHDTFGSTAIQAGSSLDCAEGDGARASTDCDDADATVFPGAPELCNDLDDDCDDLIDNDAPHAQTWYADADADGFTDPDRAVTDCNAPDGYFSATEDDCDDADADISPGAVDLPGDGIDQDCSGHDARVPDTGVAEGDTDVGDTVATKDDGCSCASSGPGPAIGWTGALLGLILRRRRRV